MYSRQVSMLANSSPLGSPLLTSRAAEVAAAAAERGSSFYAGSGSEGNAYYALHDESASGERV